MAASKTWYVYLIECSDGCLYTGIAVDPVARFKAHLEGHGARYMRLHPPLRLLATEAHPDRSAASKAEYRIKQLSAVDKRAYAAGMTSAASPA
ncbi:MAG: GIY-YIG nuclease family protein [Pseudomonadota bacterium]